MQATIETPLQNLNLMSSQMKTINFLHQITRESHITASPRIGIRDQISQMPDQILLHILFFLPTKDAARTTILSKTWKRVWDSIPCVSFDFDKWVAGDRVKAQEIINFVDESLSILSQHKAKVSRFVLKIPKLDTKIKSSIDKWVSLVTRNCVKVLDIAVDGRGQCYTFPQTIFSAESLAELRLKGCVFANDILVDTTKFICLRALVLEGVLIDKNRLQKFLSMCPLLENFAFLPGYWWAESLQLCGNPRLQAVSVSHCDYLKIEAPNLRTLDLDNTLLVNEVECTKVKKLTLSGSKVPTFMDSVRRIISKFPLLETLILDVPKVKSLQIFHPYLRRLEVTRFSKSNMKLKKFQIDAPRLYGFKYNGTDIPCLLFKRFSCLREVELDLRINKDIDSSWFLSLRENLSVLNQQKVVLTLSLMIFSDMIAFTPMLLEGSLVPSLCLSCLKLKYISKGTTTLTYAALIEGMLGSCHPNTVTVNFLSQQNHEFIEILCNTLMRREGMEKCCSDRYTFPCWRHRLQEVKVVVETLNGSRVCKGDIHGNALCDSLLTIENGSLQQVKFELKW